jgi:transposase
MEAKSFGYAELQRMVHRLAKYKASYMLFIRDYTAPFTNNQAERGLRHCKTKQKISGCFRSWQGVVDYCKIRSLFASAKKRGKNLMDSIF